MASLYDVLNAIIANRSYRVIGNCAANKTMKLTLPNGWRGIVHISAANSSGHGIYSVISTSTGGVSVSNLVASTMATLTTSSGGVLNIANTISGNIYVSVIGSVTKTITYSVS